MITKFGEIKAGTFILINGLFFEAIHDFDLYMQTLGFKWANMEGNWNDFPYYLVGRKLGYLYREEGENIIRYTVDEERRLAVVGEPIPVQQCELIKAYEADAFKLNRTFVVDVNAPIRLALGQLESLIPSIDRFGLEPGELHLSAQKIYYLAAGLHDYHLSHEVRVILESLTNEEDLEKVLKELNELVDKIEAKLSRRKANGSIAQHGYAVTGIAGKDGEAHFLYTTGLVNDHGLEFCIRTKGDVVQIGELIKYYAAGTHAGKSIDDLHKELMANNDWKYPKGKPVKSRLEKITNFTYRVSEEFDIYQILVS